MIPFARISKYGNTAVGLKMINTFRVGSSHMVLLDNTGILWGIGYNTQMQLGLPSGTNSIGAWTNIHNNVRLVSAGFDSTIIVTTDNKIYHTGLNLDSTTATNGWVDITPNMNGIDISTISALYTTAGILHICTSDGLLYAYGRNNNSNSGVAGAGSTAITTATLVSLPNAVKDMRYTVAAGTVLCQLIDTKVYGWGRNANGELGQGNTTAVATPIMIGSTSLSIGGGYSAFELVNTAVNTSGNQYSGQIGNGQTAATHVNVTNFGVRTYPGTIAGTISPIDNNTPFTMALMSTQGIYYTGTTRVPFGGANGTVTVGTYTKCSDLPIPLNDVKQWSTGSIGGAICSSTELYQCGNGVYIAGDGVSAGRFGYRKTPLPWDNY